MTLFAAAAAAGTLAMGQGNQNWTATDINGTSHSIQSYLQQDKTVLVDLSAHWCPPCWAWHKSGIMEKLYHEFGPEGTDDLMILFIDGSSNPPSNINLLNGVGSGTQGNWTLGTNYPIIGPAGQGQLVANNYDFPGFPTLFLHCPGAPAGVEIQRSATWSSFFASWRNGCGAPFNNGVNDATLLKLDNTTICPGENPKVELYNMGSAALTSVRVEMRQGNTLLQTVNWTGNLPRWQSTMVEFDQLNVVSGTTYTATVSLPNGVVDDHEPGLSEDYTYTIAPIAELATVHLQFRTDNYASESSWKLFDSNNNQVAQNGSLANATTYDHWWNLNPNECYRFDLYDGYGDGICCAYGNGFFRLRSNGTLMAEGGQFGGLATTYFKTGTAVGIAENVLDGGLGLFPNPTSGMVTVQFDLPAAGTLNIEVRNILGGVITQRLHVATVGSQQTTLDLSDLANGSYLISFYADGMSASRKLTIAR